MTIDFVSELMRQDCDMAREGVRPRCVVVSRADVAPAGDPVPTHMQLVSGCYEIVPVETAGVCELVAIDPLRWGWVRERRRQLPW